MTGRDDSVIVH